MGRNRNKSSSTSENNNFIKTGCWVADNDDLVHFYKRSETQKVTSDELHKNKVSHLEYFRKNKKVADLEDYLGCVKWDSIKNMTTEKGDCLITIGGGAKLYKRKRESGHVELQIDYKGLTLGFASWKPFAEDWSSADFSILDSEDKPTEDEPTEDEPTEDEPTEDEPTEDELSEEKTSTRRRRRN